MKQLNSQKTEAAIRKAIARAGVDVLCDARRFMGLMSDVTQGWHGLSEERIVVKRVIEDASIGRVLVDAHEKSLAEKEIALKQIKAKLKEVHIPDDDFPFICDSFTKVLDRPPIPPAKQPKPKATKLSVPVAAPLIVSPKRKKISPPHIVLPGVYKNHPFLAWFITAIVALATIATIIGFFTGKNLPDFFHVNDALGVSSDSISASATGGNGSENGGRR